MHPLGKSPIISVEPTSPTTNNNDESKKPLVLAESGLIIEYLVDHFGPWLAPERYAGSKEGATGGEVGGETESWVRYRYYMHYAEGSLMPYLVIGIIVSSKFFSHRFSKTPNQPARPLSKKIISHPNHQQSKPQPPSSSAPSPSSSPAPSKPNS